MDLTTYEEAQTIFPPAASLCHQSHTVGIVLWFNKLIDVLEVAQPKPCLSNSIWILSLQLGLAWRQLSKRCPAVFSYMYTKMPKYLVGQIRKQFFFLFPFLSLTHSPFFPSDIKIQPSHDADWESLICCSFDSDRPWIMAKWLPSICANTLLDSTQVSREAKEQPNLPDCCYDVPNVTLIMIGYICTQALSWKETAFNVAVTKKKPWPERDPVWLWCS